MNVFLGCVVFFAIVTILVLTLPVKVFFRVAGGTDNGIRIRGRLMPLAGCAGIGIGYDAGMYRMELHVLSWKALDVNVTRLVKYTEKKTGVRGARKPGPRKVETEASKSSLVERLREGIGKAKEYLGYYREAKGVFKETVRFDKFNADVTLGFGDPSLTGLITGFIFAANGVLPDKFSIRPSFDFTREVLRGSAAGEVTVLMVAVWKNIIRYSPYIIRFVKSRRKQEAELVTQEV